MDDPSRYNVDRVGNAMKAMEDWRAGKLRSPHMILASIILIVILAGGLFLLFHQPKHKTNWSILSTVPASEAQQVKKTAEKVAGGFVVPTKLPFRVQGASATVTGSGVLFIRFISTKGTITETVTTSLSPIYHVRNPQSINLQNADSSYTGTLNGYPILGWSKNGAQYTLFINKWNSTPPSDQELITVYKSMD